MVLEEQTQLLKFMTLRGLPIDISDLAIEVQGNAIETGPYTLVLTNELALENEQAGETFDSPVNNFAIAGSLGYSLNSFLTLINTERSAPTTRRNSSHACSAISMSRTQVRFRWHAGWSC